MILSPAPNGEYELFWMIRASNHKKKTKKKKIECDVFSLSWELEMIQAQAVRA
jgi:hypothetical protein